MKGIQKYFPFRYKLSLIMSLVVTITTLFLGITNYIHMNNVLEQEAEQNRLLLQQHIIDSLKNIDYTYYVMEKNAEGLMRNISKEVIDKYQKVKDPRKLELSDFVRYQNGVNIYIINSDFVVSQATDKNDLSLNFNKWPEMITFLKSVHNSKRFVADRFAVTVRKKDLKMFSYEPTKDGKYIVEVGVNLNDLPGFSSNMDFANFAKKIIEENSSIEDVILFTSSGEAYGQRQENGKLRTIAKSHYKYFKSVLTSDHTINVLAKYNGKKAVYRYIPYQIVGKKGTNVRNVIQIVFNNDILESNLKKHAITTGFFMIIAILISLGLGYFTAVFISKPISEIIDSIDKISAGNFECTADIKSNDEFRVLGESFCRMKDSLKSLIQLRNHHVDELSKVNREIEAKNIEINTLYEKTVAMNEKLQRVLKETETNYLSTVSALVNSIDAKDSYTSGHCERVTEYAVAIAKELNYSQDEILNLKFAALLHDIGKIGIPSKIINKVGKLTEEEMNIIKKHPEIGYNILKDVKFLEKSREAVLQHHERMDGKGYQRGMKGNEIELMARIIMVADAYDAMTSERPYRKNPLTKEQAIAELMNNKDIMFDSLIVDTFVKILSTGSF